MTAKSPTTAVATTTAIINTAFLKCSTPFHIQQILAHIISTGLFQYSPSFRAKLLKLTATSTYADLSYATLIFNYISKPSTYNWNIIIGAYAQSPTPRIGLTHFTSMIRTLQKPDAVTCSFALKACARALAKDEAHVVHSLVIRFGFYSDFLLQTTLMDLYCKVGEFRAAEKVFDEMRKRDIAAWNALICGLAQGSFVHEALELFHRMHKEGLKADNVTVLGALTACSQLGILKEANKLWCYIKELGLDSKVVVCNAVIDMYCKCGFADKAYDLFRNMKCKKDIITWNTMIMGFAMHGHGVEAIELLKEMESDGVQPDSVTYLGVLCACNHAGLVDEGYKLFMLMEDKGIVQNVKHFGTVVDLLGRGGRLDEAYDVIESMPFEPDIAIWQTLLGACYTYGNVKLAEISSRKLVEMGSDSCGDMVVLSNVYAKYTRWSDVGRVREALNGRDVKKVPGFSYIEVGGALHKFINGDQNHPSWREIYAKLDEIMLRIKE